MADSPICRTWFGSENMTLILAGLPDKWEDLERDYLGWSAFLCRRHQSWPFFTVYGVALQKTSCWEWILLYVAFCKITVISRQKETLLLSNDFEGFFYSAQYRLHTSYLWTLWSTVYNMHDFENMTKIRPNRNSNSVSINNRTKWDIGTGEIRFGIKIHVYICCWCTGNAGSCRSVCISENRAAYIFISMARTLQTQNICITFVQRWSNVFVLVQHCTNVIQCFVFTVW